MGISRRKLLAGGSVGVLAGVVAEIAKGEEDALTEVKADFVPSGEAFYQIRAKVRSDDNGRIEVSKEGFVIPTSTKRVSRDGWAVSVYEGHAAKPHVGDAWFRVDHFRYWQSGPASGTTGDRQFAFVLKAQAYRRRHQSEENPAARFKRNLPATIVILIPKG